VVIGGNFIILRHYPRYCNAIKLDTLRTPCGTGGISPSPLASLFLRFRFPRGARRGTPSPCPGIFAPDISASLDSAEQNRGTRTMLRAFLPHTRLPSRGNLLATAARVTFLFYFFFFFFSRVGERVTCWRTPIKFDSLGVTRALSIRRLIRNGRRVNLIALRLAVYFLFFFFFFFLFSFSSPAGASRRLD